MIHNIFHVSLLKFTKKSLSNKLTELWNWSLLMKKEHEMQIIVNLRCWDKNFVLSTLKDYDLKHDIWKSLKHLSHTLKLLESYHYMYFNKFISSSSSFKIFFTTEIQFRLITHDFSLNYIFINHCQDNLLCTIDDMRKCFMKCMFVCENIQMTHFWYKMNFAERNLLSHEKKELNEAVWDVLHERRKYCQMLCDKCHNKVSERTLSL
jgi:hypothetical protein